MAPYYHSMHNKTIKTTLKSNNIKVKYTSQTPVNVHKSEISINTVYNCNK